MITLGAGVTHVLVLVSHRCWCWCHADAGVGVTPVLVLVSRRCSCHAGAGVGVTPVLVLVPRRCWRWCYSGDGSGAGVTLLMVLVSLRCWCWRWCHSGAGVTPALKAIETEHQPDAASLYIHNTSSSKELKMHSCHHCRKTFTRKTSLTRHKEGRYKYGQPLPSYVVKTSQSTSKWSVTGTPHINVFESTPGQKRSSRSPNFNGADKETGPRNPKITALVNESINDNSPPQDQSGPPENQLPATDVF